ncbi:hypothetical protein DFH07DRAFT_976931 [Mycena maculata]|uniref:CxC5 like cysteine cluster associated with KDZ domain-containing protein n=1 Tax=Mycena maculata TaxID=230809 RepID=A0AAD7NW86_9AGAR|nr:hypothetical protein DFH07DRAFT_976931 [Mycena maculata]
MIPTLGNFIVILQLYFLHEFSLQRAFYILTVLVATYPLFRLHLNQRQEPRQPRDTAWLRSITSILAQAFTSEHEHPHFPPEEDDVGIQLGQRVCRDLEQLYHLLGADDKDSPPLFPEPHRILCTTRLHCTLCPSENGRTPTLRRFGNPQQVRLLDSGFRWVKAELYVAYCSKCLAEYYPDRLTYQRDDNTRGRLQKLECEALYLRVSKHGVWIDRRVAIAQEHAILRFHSGWSNFADWLSDTMDSNPRITTRQSQRLYFEHFARRLITDHGLVDTFTVPAHSSAQVLAASVRDAVGKDGGIVAGAMEHGCINCTHIKRYAADFLADGVVLDQDENGVVDAPGPVEPTQQDRVPGSARGYARLAVMDGKSISHRICAVTICEGPLVNYKNGRFCADHLEMQSICGIIPCGRPVHSDGAVTCDDESHKEWHQKYLNRFTRLSFPGVQRVIRRQAAANENSSVEASIHCLQTVQWSCGCPIGWGKCYRSESSPQVLKIIDNIWESHPDSRPSFLAYNDACNLLRHIATQDPNSPWITSTKLIVDAWHYIGHRATDLLCRIWCNPAPTNGSQPDLITVSVDNNGRTHTTRAFNTETAEQLNAWLNGYEAQLRQMSDVNYDFSVHVLMMLYKELVEKRVEKKEDGLTEEFWDIVEGTD